MNRPRFEGIKMAKIWLTNDYVIIISITINKWNGYRLRSCQVCKSSETIEKDATKPNSKQSIR